VEPFAEYSNKPLVWYRAATWDANVFLSMISPSELDWHTEDPADLSPKHRGQFTYFTPRANELEPYEPMGIEGLFGAAASLGDTVWEEGLDWSERLEQKTLKFLTEFGPHLGHDEGVSDPVVSSRDIWMFARAASLGLSCLRSVQSDPRLELREKVVSRARSLDLGPGRYLVWGGDLAQVKPKETGYMTVARDWLNVLVNEGLRASRVNYQIRYSPESGGWINDLRPMSLAGAVWTQMSASLLENRHVFECAFPRCRGPRYFTRGFGQNRKIHCRDRCRWAHHKEAKPVG